MTTELMISLQCNLAQVCIYLQQLQLTVRVRAMLFIKETSKVALYSITMLTTVLKLLLKIARRLYKTMTPNVYFIQKLYLLIKPNVQPVNITLI